MMTSVSVPAFDRKLFDSGNEVTRRQLLVPTISIRWYRFSRLLFLQLYESLSSKPIEVSRRLSCVAYS